MFEKSIGHTYKLITQQHRLGTDAKNIKMKVTTNLTSQGSVTNFGSTSSW